MAEINKEPLNSRLLLYTTYTLRAVLYYTLLHTRPQKRETEEEEKQTSDEGEEEERTRGAKLTPAEWRRDIGDREGEEEEKGKRELCCCLLGHEKRERKEKEGGKEKRKRNHHHRGASTKNVGNIIRK